MNLLGTAASATLFLARKKKQAMNPRIWVEPLWNSDYAEVFHLSYFSPISKIIAAKIHEKSSINFPTTIQVSPQSNPLHHPFEPTFLMRQGGRNGLEGYG